MVKKSPVAVRVKSFSTVYIYTYMDSQDDLDRLLISFLSDDITQEERKLVTDWIREDVKNMQYFQAVSIAWNLRQVKKSTDSIDVNHEWNFFKELLSTQQEKELFEYNRTHTASIADTCLPASRNPVYRIIGSSIIGATLIMVALLWIRSLHESRRTALVSQTKPAVPERQFLPEWKHVENHSITSRQIVLADGSHTTLQTGSRLSWQFPFVHNRRDVWLTGEASFVVARDSAKPFTVYSGDIAITALGTRFTVTSQEGAPVIKVALHEGKVVIRSVEHAAKRLSKDFYLLPGQELVYDKARYAAHVSTLRTYAGGLKRPARAPASIRESPALAGKRDGSWYMFNNRPLSEVLDLLQALHNTHIGYAAKDVGHKYFIGQYSASDPLEKILAQIAVLNDLKLKKVSNGFILSK